MSALSIPAPGPSQRDWLAGLVLCLHVLIVLYVATGWLGQTRLGLLVYLLVLPMILLQWLLNRGDSLICNVQALLRTGHWRDPRSNFSGGRSQALLRRISGVNVGHGSIHLVVSAAMVPLWIEAFYQMVLIPTRV